MYKVVKQTLQITDEGPKVTDEPIKSRLEWHQSIRLARNMNILEAENINIVIGASPPVDDRLMPVTIFYVQPYAYDKRRKDSKKEQS